MNKTAKLAVALLALNGLKPIALKAMMKHEPLRSKLLDQMVQEGTSDETIQSWAIGLKKLIGWDLDYATGYLTRIRDNKRNAL